MPRKIPHQSQNHQTGQRFNGAEAVMPRKMLWQEWADMVLFWLQWGRGSDASEDATRGGNDRRFPLCFNGAEAVMPRKIIISINNSIMLNRASMGPRQ